MAVGELIAIIDDDPIASMITNRILLLYGEFSEVKTFHSISAFLRAVQSGYVPSIILLDINLPGEDGWSLIDEYSAFLPSECKVFMLTSSIDSRDIEKARHLKQISGYLMKPLNADSVKVLGS